MPREIKKINTPNGNEVEIYSYMTGLDQREIDKIFLEYALDDDMPATIPKEKKIEIQQKQQDKTIQNMVISINGEKDKNKILEMVLSWPIGEFNFLMREINIACFGGESKKKESAGN